MSIVDKCCLMLHGESVKAFHNKNDSNKFSEKLGKRSQFQCIHYCHFRERWLKKNPWQLPSYKLYLGARFWHWIKLFISALTVLVSNVSKVFICMICVVKYWEFVCNYIIRFWVFILMSPKPQNSHQWGKVR